MHDSWMYYFYVIFIVKHQWIEWKLFYQNKAINVNIHNIGNVKYFIYMQLLIKIKQ